MRRTAILLALTVAALDLTAFAAGEVRVARDVGSVFELGVDAWLSRVNLTVVFVLPWVVGAVLLFRDRRSLGAAVIIPAALLALPRLLLVGRTFDDAADGDSLVLWIESSTVVATWLSAAAAGVLAWLSLPRDGFRHGAPGRGSAYTVVAFLAWLSTILASTQFFVPGTEGTSQGARHFYEYIWTTMGTLGATVGVAEALVFGALLLVGPSLRRDLAGALVLVVALPALVAEVQTIVTVAGEPFLISTPASFIGTAGLAGVVGFGIVWLVRGARTEASRGSGGTSGDEARPAVG